LGKDHDCCNPSQSSFCLTCCTGYGKKKNSAAAVTSLLNKKTFQFAFFAGLFILFLLTAFYIEQYYLIAVPFAALLLYTGWQYLNLLFFLLLLSLPFSAEYHFSQTLGTDIPDEFLMLFVSALFFFYWIYSPQKIPKNILLHPLLIFLVVSLIWTAISVFFSTHIIISVKYILAKCWYLGAFVLAPVIIFRQKQNIRIAAIILAGSMLTVAIIALIKHSSNDFHFANINDAVTPFFRNHVNYSAMLVCIIPVFFAFFRLSHTKRQKILTGLAIIVLLIALFFSYARGAWLALIAGIAAYRLIKKGYLVISFITILIIILTSLFWIKSNDRYLQFAHDYNTTIFHSDFKQHLIATYRLKDVSTAERFYRWIAGVRMIKDNWLTGYGPNTFYYNYKGYAIPAFKTWVSKNEDHSTVHNYFLLITIEQGIPGLIFFLVLLGGMLYYAQHLYHRIQDVFYKMVSITTGVMLVMITIVNFLSDLVETDKIGSLFFLCLSTLIVTDINTKNKSDFSSNI
jgi:O-antigen ligase